MKIDILDAFHAAGVGYATKHFETVRWDEPRVKNWHEEADAVMVRMTPLAAASYSTCLTTWQRVWMSSSIKTPRTPY